MQSYLNANYGRIVSLTRKAMKDFRFSDGTLIPEGAFVSAAFMSIHHDEAYYENPDVFDPLMFADIRNEEGEGLKHQMVSTSLEYIPFGHGRHAWYVKISAHLLPLAYSSPLLFL